MSHRSSWGAPIWPPTPPSARTRPGGAVARLGVDTGCLIDRRGGPRYGPPHPPALGRAPAQPGRAPGLTQEVSSLSAGGERVGLLGERPAPGDRPLACIIPASVGRWLARPRPAAPRPRDPRQSP